MRTPTKLLGFGLVLAAVVAVGAAIGAGVGPIDTGGSDEHGTDHAAQDDTAAEAPDVGGLLVADGGYRLEADGTTLAAGAPQTFAFRIVGPDGEPVERYDLLHDRELHLIVVSRDLVEYAHLHPTRAEDGTWSVELPTLGPGSHRAIADFRPAGADQRTVGVDLTVPGDAAVRALVERTTAEVDGYTVTLTGDLVGDGEVTVTVERDGQVITTEPYLGAAGHLVAIRSGDRAYLHVHPIDEVPSGPVRFGITVPSAGTYALFFDFAHDGSVHSAPFVVTVDEVGGTTGDHDEHGGH